MPAYLVRLIKNRDIVGFFAADHIIDLLITVDECNDVSDCEYVELPPGGIMWTSPAVAIPLDCGTPETELHDTENELPWTSAELSEAWWSAVYGLAGDEWTPFDPSVEPDGKPMGPGQVIPMRKNPRSGRRI